MTRTIDVRIDGVSRNLITAHVTLSGIASYAGPMAIVGGIYLPLHAMDYPGAHPYVSITSDFADLLGL